MKNNRIFILFLIVTLALCLLVACDGLGGVNRHSGDSQKDPISDSVNPPTDDMDNPINPPSINGNESGDDEQGGQETPTLWKQNCPYCFG